jgi:hypothetical protein
MGFCSLNPGKEGIMPKEELFRAIFERMERLIGMMDGPRAVFAMGAHPPLVIERIEEDSYRIGHYCEAASGEVLAVPEMLVRFDPARKKAHALYFRHDSLGILNEIYQQKDGEFVVDLREQTHQNRFLESWLSDLERLMDLPETV